MRISVRFAWYDLWIGAYWDRIRRILYICPLPTLLVIVEPPVECDNCGRHWGHESYCWRHPDIGGVSGGVLRSHREDVPGTGLRSKGDPRAVRQQRSKSGRVLRAGRQTREKAARAAAVLVIALMLISPIPTLAVDGCRVIPVDPVWAPTGVAGCEIYGEGKASWWHGEGIARNDCVWPWTACQPVKVTSLQTNRSIVVVPTMFCGCFTGTPDERIVDLDLAAVLALGLDRSEGLFPVVVESAAVGESEPPSTLPDTAAQQ